MKNFFLSQKQYLFMPIISISSQEAQSYTNDCNALCEFNPLLFDIRNADASFHLQLTYLHLLATETFVRGYRNHAF